MFFNGDVDSVCNVMHNAQFVQKLGYPLKQAKQPWNDMEQLPPTVGFVTKYEGENSVSLCVCLSLSLSLPVSLSSRCDPRVPL